MSLFILESFYAYFDAFMYWQIDKIFSLYLKQPKPLRESYP
jgi:hypothetical protein